MNSIYRAQCRAKDNEIRRALQSREDKEKQLEVSNIALFYSNTLCLTTLATTLKYIFKKQKQNVRPHPNTKKLK